MPELTEAANERYGREVNWQASVETVEGQVLTGVIEPGVADRTATATSAAADDWLCAWCLNRVAHEQDRFKYEGKDEFSFANPAGIRFEIITFAQTQGCRQAGVPTLEHTWFPGYAWSFCQCDRCGVHLGWYYTGPNQFAGLIKDRIVRGTCVRN